MIFCFLPIFPKILSIINKITFVTNIYRVGYINKYTLDIKDK